MPSKVGVWLVREDKSLLVTILISIVIVVLIMLIDLIDIMIFFT